MERVSSATPEVERAREQPRVWALVTLFVAPAFIFANMYSTQAILPVLSKVFHVPAPTAGLTVSVLVLAVAIGSLFYGPLSDRIGRKPVMVGVSFLVILPTLLLAFAPNFTTLVILRAIQGLLMPGLTSVAISYVNEEFSGKGRGLAMGIYVSGLTLGGLFARVGSAALTGFFDWQVALLSFALPTLIAALIMWRFLPDRYSRKELDGHAMRQTFSSFFRDSTFLRQTLQDMRMHLRNRRLVGAFIIGFTSFFGFIGIFTYLPFYLTGPHFRLPTIALSLVYLLWLTGVGSPIAGSIASRIGSRRAMAFSMGLVAIGLLITLVPVLWIVMFGLSLVTLGMFSTVPAANLYLGEQATRAKGTAASLYLSLYYFGGSIGAVLPGLALIWAGWPGVTLLCLGMVLVALTADALLCR
ncbi:MAG TPA: MFS transporter [Ktedonobacteraceae bacterium]|nr:MFS transporter [Ktedonobacteraceae bacterium]